MCGSAWTCLVSIGVGAEGTKTHPVSSELAASVGVAATQRDLDRIRAAGDPRLSGLANPSGPRVSVPELRTDSVETPLPAGPAPSVIRGVKPEQNASNWLVEAMEQGARDREERQRASQGLPRREERAGPFRAESGSESWSAASVLLRDNQNSGNERSRTRTAEAGAIAPGAKRPGAENPLANYLGDWLTPQDYALLATGLTAGAGGAVALPGAGNSPLGTGYNASAASAGLRDLARAGGGAPTLKPEAPGGFAAGTAPLAAGGFGTTRENPFLAGLNDPSKNPPPVASLQPPLAATPPPETAGTRPQLRSPEMPPPVPKVPDLAKPRPDETYFKQLKRF